MTLLLSIVLIIVSIFFLSLAVTLFKTDSAAYQAVHKKAGNFFDPIKGTVPVSTPIGSDSRVAAGMAFDKKHNRIISQGTLSDEALNSITG